jgi:outer membrane protein OmpA-like peptidoglycan-associated protein
MKHLGWVLFAVLLVASVALYLFGYRPLQKRCQQQRREAEMWLAKTEQMKRKADLDETRQKMAPNVSLLLADVFPGMDSFSLSRFGRDTLAALAQGLRRTSGIITVAVYTDDQDINLYTKQNYPEAISFAAAKGAVAIRYLVNQGVPAERIILQAHGTGQARGATIPDLRAFSSRRLEITVRTTGGSEK